MAGVTPKQVYQALIGAGASTTQAIGIMANSINESGLDPEVKNLSDPNGGSYGFVQQNGSQYASLVTNNPAADLAAQIKVLAQNGGFAAASGSTGAQAAGNFAAKYEVCQGCQAGQAQYNSRVANAATVEGWISSGNWPTSAGSPSSGSGSTSATAAGSGNNTDPTCAFGTGAINLHVGSIPAICILKKTTLRHMAGAAIISGGGLVLIAGAVILAASAFQRSGAARAVEQVAQYTPGAGQVVAVARRAAPSQRPQRVRQPQ